MIRFTLVAIATLSLALLQPPAVASLGQPAPTGMSGTLATQPSGDGMLSIDMLKYGLTQGGLTLVLLVVFWSYRRDLGRIEQRDQEKLAIVTALVEKNTAALVTSEQTNERLARAVEALRPGAGL